MHSVMTAFIMILKSMILNLLKSIKLKAVVSLQHIKNHDLTSVIGGGEGTAIYICCCEGYGFHAP